MIEPEAIAALASYPWPGNVRQLRHVVERLVATLDDGVTITAKDIYRALPAATFSAAMSELPIFEQNDSLDAFLDRTLLFLYDQLVA